MNGWLFSVSTGSLPTAAEFLLYAPIEFTDGNL